MGPAVLLRIAAIVALALVILAAALALRNLRGPRRTADAMTALEHVQELRDRLLRVVVAWLVAVVAVFSFRIETRGGWPVPIPALQDNIAAQAFRRIADHLVPENVTLVVVRPLDGFFAEVTIAAALGAILAGPVLWSQAAAYVAPALRSRERRLVAQALAPAIVLFLLGAAFAWYAVLPLLLTTLYGYSEALGATPLLQVSELVTFSVVMVLVFGVAFQLPLVMTVLARSGLVQAEAFARGWRVAVVVILVASALLSDPTVISQLVVAGPLLVLYGLGIGMARLVAPDPDD